MAHFHQNRVKVKNRWSAIKCRFSKSYAVIRNIGRVTQISDLGFRYFIYFFLCKIKAMRANSFNSLWYKDIFFFKSRKLKSVMCATLPTLRMAACNREKLHFYTDYRRLRINFHSSLEKLIYTSLSPQQRIIFAFFEVHICDYGKMQFWMHVLTMN